MQNVYAVVGTGIAPKKVIQEGLRDALKEGDAVSLTWVGKPNTAMEAVYDYLLDNEVQFVLYYNDDADPAPPRAFRNAENGVVQKVKKPSLKAISDISGKGKVLFMWDAEEEDDQIDFVFDNAEAGTLILELTNGLAPIKSGEDIPEPKEPEIAKDADETAAETRLSKLELETATAAVVKRYGARLGCKAATKSGIIAELFPEGEEVPDDVKEEKADLAALNAHYDEKDPTDESNYISPDDPDYDSLVLLNKIDMFLTWTFGEKYTQSQ